VNYFNLIKRGIIHENPIFVQMLALCPLLAVTTSAINGFAMGAATTMVLIAACVVISILRKLIPNEIRIVLYIIIVAAFVVVIQLLMEAFLPEINDALGIFIALIVVNCLILARVEAFASKNSVIPSIVDSFGMGLGFTLSLTLVGIIREVLGSGSIFGFVLMQDSTMHMMIMIMAPGAFFTLGGIMMILKHFQLKKGGER